MFGIRESEKERQREREKEMGEGERGGINGTLKQFFTVY